MTAMLGEWFTTGFPEDDPATEPQKHLLNRNLSIVLQLLSQEERFAVELQGVEDWLNRQTKSMASAHINRVMGVKRGMRDKAVAGKVSKNTGKKCVCGQVMLTFEDGYRCQHCGKVEFHVRMC